VNYVSNKCIRQLGLLSKETLPGPGEISRRYLVGLSLGTSSSVLLHVLNEYASNILAKGQREPFQLCVVYVDTGMVADQATPETLEILKTYEERYPRLKIERIPLAAAIGLPTIDWSTLPSVSPGSDAGEQLQHLLQQLPSPTSRTDMIRLFIRHILVSTAVRLRCQAVLFGHSTTALAETTLAETAKGKGFSLPWLINDGVLELPLIHQPSSEDGEGKLAMRIRYPLRELFRKELITYATLTEPKLADIIPANESSGAGAVVSHRDLSIDEVMTRYFHDVEDNYPSVVANVVRTTAKLDRVSAANDNGQGPCVVCSMPLDEQGDERWEGEIGRDDLSTVDIKRRLCYGCRRSIQG
jgi:cytoplasmic tRNA 2-thiolation protein 2